MKDYKKVAQRLLQDFWKKQGLPVRSDDVSDYRQIIDMFAQALAREREVALDEAAALVIKYAVNLGGHGPVKPLFEDHRGKDDVVRNAYAVAIRALKSVGVNQAAG